MSACQARPEGGHEARDTAASKQDVDSRADVLDVVGGT